MVSLHELLLDHNTGALQHCKQIALQNVKIWHTLVMNLSYEMKCKTYILNSQECPKWSWLMYIVAMYNRNIINNYIKLILCSFGNIKLQNFPILSHWGFIVTHPFDILYIELLKLIIAIKIYTFWLIGWLVWLPGCALLTCINKSLDRVKADLRPLHCQYPAGYKNPNCPVVYFC
jgi:hypothetical protein